MYSFNTSALTPYPLTTSANLLRHEFLEDCGLQAQLSSNPKVLVAGTAELAPWDEPHDASLDTPLTSHGLHERNRLPRPPNRQEAFVSEPLVRETALSWSALGTTLPGVFLAGGVLHA